MIVPSMSRAAQRTGYWASVITATLLTVIGAGAEEHFGLTPDMLLDRIVATAKSDALTVIIELLDDDFEADNWGPQLLPMTSRIIPALKHDPNRLGLNLARVTILDDLRHFPDALLKLGDLCRRVKEDLDKKPPGQTATPAEHAVYARCMQKPELGQALLELAMEYQRVVPVPVNELIVSILEGADISQALRKFGLDLAGVDKPLSDSVVSGAKELVESSKPNYEAQVRGTSPFNGFIEAMAKIGKRFTSLSAKGDAEIRRIAVIQLIQDVKGELFRLIAVIKQDATLTKKFKDHFRIGIDDFERGFRHVFDFATALIDRNYTAAILQFITLASSAPPGTDAARNQTNLIPVTRMLTLIAAIAGAQDAEQAQAILDAAVAPPQTWRELRSRPGSHVAVTAYLGLGGGIAVNQSAEHDREGWFGVSAPVGIQFQHTLAVESPLAPQGFGILLAPIDLGTLAQYRYSSRSERSEARWQDVLAPGIWLTIPLTRYAPLSLTLGAQYAPAFRNDGTTGRQLEAFQFGAALAWEVPLLTF